MPIEPQETELSKAIAEFIKSSLLSMVGGCFMLMAFITFFGWWLGGCYMMNYHDEQMKALNGISPVTSVRKR